jgi:hypothetical protein
MKRLVMAAVLALAGFTFAQVQPPVDWQKKMDSLISTLPAEQQAKIAALKAEFEKSIPADVQAKIDEAKARVAELQKMFADTTKLTPEQIKALIDAEIAKALAKKDELLAKLPADQKAKVEAALADMQKRIDAAKAMIDAKLK